MTETKVAQKTVIPEPPEYLNKRSRKIFKTTYNKLLELGVAQECDTNILAQYASLMDLFECLEDGMEDGINKAKTINQRIKLSTMLLQLARELGLSPMSRAKMKVVEKVEEENIEDTL